MKVTLCLTNAEGQIKVGEERYTPRVGVTRRRQISALLVLVLVSLVLEFVLWGSYLFGVLFYTAKCDLMET